MINTKITQTIVAIACLFAGGAYAQTQTVTTTAVNQTVVDKAIAAKIEAGLAKGKIKSPAVTEVRTTPINGVYEVRFGHDIIYTNADASYLLQGPLVDIPNGVNITQEYVNKLTAIKFKDLPIKDAIVTVRGNGSRKIAIFEDPNCGYCKMFAKEIKQIDNVTIYTFLYPILGPDSVKKSTAVWCAKDKGKVWSEWMENATPIPDLTCANTPLERNIAFGKKYNINGTPALIFEDGTKAPGVMKADKLEEKFKEIKK